MQAVKLVFPGEYWDTQIYEGRLYLFTTSGTVRTIDWDLLMRGFSIDDSLRLALECAFSRSDYLYGMQWDLLFSDLEIKETIRRKFERLELNPLTVDRRNTEPCELPSQDVPFPFPHTDCTIYHRKLYAATRQGLYRTTCNKRNKRPLRTPANREWDCPIVSVSASYKTLALAAGDEGLYEMKLENGWTTHGRDEPTRTSTKNCIACSWAFHSIYTSSHVSDGSLVAYVKNRHHVDRYPDRDQPDFQRDLDRIISDDEIFGGEGYSWGTQDKLCQATSEGVHVVRYEPWHERSDERLQDAGVIRFQDWKGCVVAAGVALFGTVIECDDAVIVLRSDGEMEVFHGEPVNWRVFPRSKHYENQLHIVYDNRLEIYSFNHDYFVDQKQKRSGTQFFRGGGSRPLTRQRGWGGVVNRAPDAWPGDFLDV